MNINAKDLTKIVSYFSPIAHTPGRLRLRVSSKIKEISNEVNLGSIDEIIKKINGIKNVKFNKIIGSITIEYDPHIFAPHLWNDLLAGKNLEQILKEIEKVAKRIL